MAPPGFLQDPDVQRWLAGIEPAWTLLDLASLNALREESPEDDRVIRRARDLTSDEIAPSAVTRNTLILLQSAVDKGGLKLTATGNLSRAVVGEMREIIEWPNYDQADALRLHKVVNEPDFLPLHFVRSIAQMSGLFRQYRGKLIATRKGREMLSEDAQKTLQALLFNVTFWRVDLSYFGRGLLGTWPQADIGIVLWSLSVAATEWQSPEALTRLCTIPIDAVLDSAWDRGTHAMEARILRPLEWFGVLHGRPEVPNATGIGRRYTYRKAPLFDRFLAFDVRVEEGRSTRH